MELPVTMLYAVGLRYANGNVKDSVTVLRPVLRVTVVVGVAPSIVIVCVGELPVLYAVATTKANNGWVWPERLNVSDTVAATLVPVPTVVRVGADGVGASLNTSILHVSYPPPTDVPDSEPVATLYDTRSAASQ